MKTQKVTKSSKFTQASPNDNEYQNIGLTVLPVSPYDEGNQNLERNPYPGGHCHNSSELLLRSEFDYKAQETMHEIRRYSPERNANQFQQQQQHQQQQQQQQQQSQDLELCNCITPIYGGAKTRGIILNRSLTSLPKLENSNLSQDEKTGKMSKQGRPRHTFACEQNRRVSREEVTMRRMQSPEIINIHRGPFYEARGGVEDCEVGFKCKDHEFRRGHSVRNAGSRSIISGHQKRRPAGDGMDSEMDEPEIAFEMSGHLGDRQCPCDHVMYSPTSYAGCMQIPSSFDFSMIES